MAAKLWDRQGNESTEAYEAARIYFELGIDRSITKVADLVGCRKGAEGVPKQPKKRSPGYLQRWSVIHQWQIRSREYDKWKSKTDAFALRKEMARTARVRARTLAERKTTAEDGLWDAFNLSIRRVNRLNKQQADYETALETDPQTTIAEPADGQVTAAVLRVARLYPMVKETVIETLSAAEARSDEPTEPEETPKDRETEAMWVSMGMANPAPAYDAEAADILLSLERDGVTYNGEQAEAAMEALAKLRETRGYLLPSEGRTTARDAIAEHVSMSDDDDEDPDVEQTPTPKKTKKVSCR